MEGCENQKPAEDVNSQSGSSVNPAPEAAASEKMIAPGSAMSHVLGQQQLESGGTAQSPSSAVTTTDVTPKPPTDVTMVQVDPLAVDANSGVLPANGTLSPEGNGTVQAIPLAVSVAPGMQPMDGNYTQETDALGMVPILPKTSPLDNEEEDNQLMNDEKPLEKCKVKKRPRRLQQRDPKTKDVNKTKEKIRWKDVWVAQLIHIRGRMHSTFTNPQRQRVDLWQIVEREMTNSCYGFDKDSEACRKKWLRIYKEYKDDLHLANKDEAQKCRFYDLVDFYMGDRAKNMHSVPVLPDPLSIQKEAIASPVMNEVDVKAKDSGAAPLLLQASPNSHVTETAETGKKTPAKRPRVTEKPLVIEKVQTPAQEPPSSSTSKKGQSSKAVPSSIQTMLSELVTIGKEMLQTTREYEKEKLSVLHSMKDMLGRIAKKM